MDIKKSLSIFIHLLALTGYAALSLNSSTSLVLSAVFIAVLFASLYTDLTEKKYLLKSTYCNLLAVLLVLILAARLFVFNEELFALLIYFIIYVQLIKFLGKKELKDYEQIILISFFQLLAGAVTTTKIYFGLLLVVFILLSVISIFLFNIRKEQHGIKDGIKKDTKFRYSTLLSSTTVIWIIVVVLSLSVFLLMPRFKGNFLSSSLLNKQKLSTGFNDEIELGQVGEIKKDSSPVMRVKFLNKTRNELPDTIYWRGVALDYFDGRFWTQRYKNQKTRIGKNYDGLFVLEKSNEQNLAIQEIVAQPIDTDVIFAANLPVVLADLPFRNVYTVNNSYYHNNYFTNNIKYKAYSKLSVPKPELLKKDVGANLDNELKYFTDSFVVSPAVENLYIDLYDEDTSVYENVKNVENYLKNNLSYTRVLENSGDTSPLDQFLFEGGEGHCEYFATAMVVLLREMRIPSRLVTGFVGGEYNTIGEYFLIRESDAHAWVEVYFPTAGWVTFDPTPGDNSGIYTGFNLLTGSLEYLKYRWNRYVVDFNVNDQQRIFKSISNRSGKVNFNIASKFKPDNARKYFLVAAVLFFLLIVSKKYKKHILRIKGKSKFPEVVNIYKKSLLIMQKRGFVKQPHMTSNEFMEYIKTKEPDNDFLTITTIYNKLKFSGKEDKNMTKLLKDKYFNLKKKSN